MHEDQCFGNTILKFHDDMTFASQCKIHLPVTDNVFRMATTVVACIDQLIGAMRCLSLGIIYILMQVRYNPEICNEVRINSAYCFGLYYFGINIREKSSYNFKFHGGKFVLESGLIADLSIVNRISTGLASYCFALLFFNETCLRVYFCNMTKVRGLLSRR